jgi:hypothetical protein
MVNEWNQDAEFSSAHIDKAGNAVLEYEISLVGGVSREKIEAFITAFRSSVVHWARFALDHVPASQEGQQAKVAQQ